MSNLDDSHRLGKGWKAWNKWREDHPGRNPDFRCDAFSKVDFRRINLKGVDFERAELAGALFLRLILGFSRHIGMTPRPS